MNQNTPTYRFGDYVRLTVHLESPCTLNAADYLTVISTRFVNGQEIVTVGMNVGYARQLHKFSISSGFLQSDTDARPFGCDKYKLFPGTTIAYDENTAVVLWSNEKETGLIFENEDMCTIPTWTCDAAKVSQVWANTVREGEIVRPVRNLQRVIAVEKAASLILEQRLHHPSVLSWDLGIVSQKTRSRGPQGEWSWWYVITPFSLSLEPSEIILLSSEYFVISFY
jgi:hypothetical protein